MSYTFKEALIEDLRLYGVHRDTKSSWTKLFWPTFKNCLYNRGFSCVFLYRVNKELARHSWVLARLFSNFRSRRYAADIDYRAEIGPGFKIVHPFDIVIGGSVRIGHHFTIYNGVTIGAKRFNEVHLKPRLGNNITIGTGAKVLGGIVIDDNCIIGALTFCDKSLPAHSTAYGNPMLIKPHSGG